MAAPGAIVISKILYPVVKSIPYVVHGSILLNNGDFTFTQYDA